MTLDEQIEQFNAQIRELENALADDYFKKKIVIKTLQRNVNKILTSSQQAGLFKLCPQINQKNLNTAADLVARTIAKRNQG